MADFHAHVVVSDTTVPVISGNRPSFLNLDNAASTPPFEQTLTAINEFAPWYSSVHRGGGFKSRLSTYAYEACRRIVGEFFGADPKDYVVIFGKNTTEALNKLAYRLPLRKTDIVLISHMEHHSNDLPWRARATVKRIGVTADGRVDRHHFLSLLEKYAGRVRLVSISGASNVTGYMPDIYWFARKAHAAGAQIAVDCAQLAAHRRIRVGTLSDPAHLDYIACSAHKMYAPFGTGVLVGRRDTFTRGEPEYRGGGTVTLVTPQQVDWAAPPDCEEAGTPNVLGVVHWHNLFVYLKLSAWIGWPPTRRICWHMRLKVCALYRASRCMAIRIRRGWMTGLVLFRLVWQLCLCSWWRQYWITNGTSVFVAAVSA